MVKSAQQTSLVAGKLFNTVIGRRETIDTLQAGPDKNIWMKSLAN